MEPVSYTKEEILNYYSTKEIVLEILRVAEQKEFSGSFGGKGYTKRPDVLLNPGDLIEFVKSGVTSFHISEETWRDPLEINTYNEQNKLSQLRTGWDLIFDIDCDELEFSKVTTHVIVQALQSFGISNVCVKFSGNHGFHIGVPFESFPHQISNKSVAEQFPDIPRKMAEFLKEIIRSALSTELLNRFTIDHLRTCAQKNIDPESITVANFNPFDIIEIDTVLIASRHLYRCLFSINEKSGLISVPLEIKDILTFDRPLATMDYVREHLDYYCGLKYMDRSKSVPEEALEFFVQAIDFATNLEEKRMESLRDDAKQSRSYEYADEKKLEEDHFPPCIKKILAGITDGKKRAIFILRNFLNTCHWTREEIVERINDWNKENQEPLRQTIVNTQLKYLNPQEKILPPNCREYYEGMSVCCPDKLCEKVKNPVSYASKKSYLASLSEEKPAEKRTLSPEQIQKMQDAKKKRKEMKEKIEKEKQEGTYQEQTVNSDDFI